MTHKKVRLYYLFASKVGRSGVTDTQVQKGKGGSLSDDQTAGY